MRKRRKVGLLGVCLEPCRVSSAWRRNDEVKMEEDEEEQEQEEEEEDKMWEKVGEG